MPNIIKHFDQLDQHVFTAIDLGKVMNAQHSEWNLASRTTRNEFIHFLETNTSLRRVTFRSEQYRDITRYSWGRRSAYELALSFRGHAYLSHHSAVFLHDLTDQVPTTVYLNHEQSPKATSSQLSQESIDRAFARKARSSNYVLTGDGMRVTIVNGKFTNRFGVVKLSTPFGKLDVTDLERTLVDIVVRPNYSAGIHEVVKAYRSAIDQVSSNRLAATLKALDHSYPYHQAIGFLLQRSGASASTLSLFRRMEMKYDFYLTYNIQDPAFDPRWRLYYPSTLDENV